MPWWIGGPAPADRLNTGRPAWPGAVRLAWRRLHRHRLW